MWQCVAAITFPTLITFSDLIAESGMSCQFSCKLHNSWTTNLLCHVLLGQSKLPWLIVVGECIQFISRKFTKYCFSYLLPESGQLLFCNLELIVYYQKRDNSKAPIEIFTISIQLSSKLPIGFGYVEPHSNIMLAVRSSSIQENWHSKIPPGKEAARFSFFLQVSHQMWIIC